MVGAVEDYQLGVGDSAGDVLSLRHIGVPVIPPVQHQGGYLDDWQDVTYVDAGISAAEHKGCAGARAEVDH